VGPQQFQCLWERWCPAGVPGISGRPGTNLGLIDGDFAKIRVGIKIRQLCAPPGQFVFLFDCSAWESPFSAFPQMPVQVLARLSSS